MKRTAILLAVIILFSCGKKGDIKTVLTAFAGTVKVNDSIVKNAGMILKPGDIIETGDNSFCDIMVNEKNILRIKADTRLILHITPADCFLGLEKGWLGGITKEKFTAEGRYKIKTPTVVAAVRGTSFCVKVEKENSTYFCVCNGSINLAEEGKKTGEDVTASHHAARRFTKEADAIKIDANPGLLYHNDAGIEELAGIIKEKIDWSKPD